MTKKQPDLGSLLNSPETAHLLKNKQTMESLLKSSETQRLMELLNQNAGGGLKNAAQSAMKGDTAQLMSLMERVMKDPQSAKLVEDLQKKFQRE